MQKPASLNLNTLAKPRSNPKVFQKHKINEKQNYYWIDWNGFRSNKCFSRFTCGRAVLFTDDKKKLITYNNKTKKTLVWRWRKKHSDTFPEINYYYFSLCISAHILYWKRLFFILPWNSVQKWIFRYHLT